MPMKTIVRLTALCAGILLCLGLALGACMSRPANSSNPSGTVNTPTSTTKAKRSTDHRNDADAGAARGEKSPIPSSKRRRVIPKGNKGMLGMVLEGGD